jgi:hypothetical protein
VVVVAASVAAVRADSVLVLDLALAPERTTRSPLVVAATVQPMMDKAATALIPYSAQLPRQVVAGLVDTQIHLQL